MRWFSGALELDSSKKDSISIQIPVLNFLDTDTLITWFKARNIALRLGVNFKNRINVYLHFFTAATVILDIFFLLVLSNLVSVSLMSNELWLMLSLITIIQNIWTIIAVYSYAMLNNTVRDQVKRVTQIKQLLLGLVHDQDLMGAEPKDVQNPTQRRALLYFRAGLGKGARPAEVASKVLIQTQRTLEAIQSVQSNLESDLKRNQSTLFGIRLMPRSITVFLLVLVGACCLIFAQNYSQNVEAVKSMMALMA